jgi:GNAT superfamily N-acetyltransferase
MKLFFINEMIDEGEILNNTQFKIIQRSQDEFLIKAIYNGQEIGYLHLDIMNDMYEYFMGDYTEEEYDQLFPNNIGAFISEIKSYGFRGEGIAKKLMEMAIQKTKQLNLDRIYLNASPIKDTEINSAAGKPLELGPLVQFYESFGFKTLKSGPQNVEMLLIMTPINEMKNIIKNNLKVISENKYIQESFINDIKFKLSKHDDEYTYEAIYNNEIIGNAHMDIIHNTQQYFEGDFTESQIAQIFQEPLFAIEWVEIPDDYYKGAGVGRALMNKILTKAKQSGHKQIYLNASPIGHNGLAINDLVNWYKTFGFEPILDQGHNVQMLMNMK